MKTRALFGSLAAVAALLAGAGPASAAIVINEVESDDAVVADYVELMNTGAAPVDIGGYVVKDSDDGHAFTIPSPTLIPANGYYVADVDGPGGFGLGKDDQARLFSNGGTLLDSYAWTSHAAATYGRCPNGTGPIVATASPTRGAANDCPIPATAWPGSASVATADNLNVFGKNLSGLYYQPATQSSPAVLWAVRNSPSTLFRLIYDGSKWTPDTANGWGAGKQLVYPNGGGVPDAEGVTLAGGDATGVYVSVERNDSGAESNISRPGVLRFDVTAPGATLIATHDWNLTADLPGLDKNAGLEAITWLPDEWLVTKGFMDTRTGAKYDPANYAGHGKGLFAVGIEQTGQVIVYALDSMGGYQRIATLSSGFPKVMDLSFDPERSQVWAVCDDSCNGRTATLDVDGAGQLAVKNVYERPGGMINLNNEGFAIAPQSECVNGLKPVFYSDDDNTDLHALRTGSISCTPLPKKDEPAPTPTPDPGTQPPAAAVPTTVTPDVKPAVTADRTAPRLAASFKVRRTGKLSATITLNERADLTLSAKAGKRTVLKSTTRKGVAAGKRTYTLKVKGVRKGTRIKLTVVARDAAGNVTTRTASAKVQ
jgi:hypothetical protein